MCHVMVNCHDIDSAFSQGFQNGLNLVLSTTKSPSTTASSSVPGETCPGVHPHFFANLTGAVGYLIKSQPSNEIAEAVVEVHRGGSPISPQIASYLVRTFQNTS